MSNEVYLKYCTECSNLGKFRFMNNIGYCCWGNVNDPSKCTLNNINNKGDNKTNGHK